METTLEKPRVDDPVIELIEGVRRVIKAPDCLRSVVVFSLSYLSVMTMAFVSKYWYQAHERGVAVDVYHVLGSIILTMSILLLSLLTTFPLMALTWNHAKMELDPQLTDLLNSLIFWFSVYVLLGFILTTFGLIGDVLPAVLFYGVSFFLIQKLGHLQLAKNEVTQIHRAYERLRRQDGE